MNEQQKLDRELAHAIENDGAKKVRELIAAGADINAAGKWSGGCTMLWLVTSQAGQEISKHFQDLAAGLAECLPNVRQRDRAAERQKHLRRLRMLIEAGADVNKPSHGGTPLRIAVFRKDLEVVKLLLANGADPNADGRLVATHTLWRRKCGGL